MTDPIEIMARAMAEADNIQICSDAMYRFSSYGIKAQAALRALADAGIVLCEAEPVGWKVVHEGWGWDWDWDLRPLTDADKADGWTETPLYRPLKGPSDE